MLTTTYKVISKILAQRFKQIVPKFVGKQQIGFVLGWCITDNILAFKLCQEHALATTLNVIYMKLDFKKAFDRVDHAYFGLLCML